MRPLAHGSIVLNHSIMFGLTRGEEGFWGCFDIQLNLWLIA